MTKEKQTATQNEETKYYGAIPKEVLEDITPDIRVQYFFWDEMLKRQIQLHPEMFPPLVKETFGKEYPAGTDIRILSTEYVVDRVREHGEKRIESIRSDLLIQIGAKDLYHMECQMKQGGDIAVRMLEYDMNIALVHGLEWVENTQEDPARNVHSHKHRLKFPRSAILYLDTTKQTPCEESCTLIFPDGTEYEYYFPVLKVQSYTPEMMSEKNLNILFPFSPIRFRRRFEAIRKKKMKPGQYEKSLKNMETLKKELTKFISDCIMIINREEQNGTLEEKTGADIMEFMGRACDNLFNKEPELLREVHETMEPVIKLFREELQEQKESELRLMQQQIEQKDADFRLAREEMKQQIEQKDAALRLIREELQQREMQLENLIPNYIQQCKRDGKTKDQAKQALQNIFFFTAPDAEKQLKKWW